MDETGAPSATSNDNSIDDSSLNPDIQTGGNGKNGHGGTNLRRGHLAHRNDYLVPRLPASLGGVGDDSNDPIFQNHVKNLRGTMFYVCQGSCLCGTVNNRGKVIYCYGDLVPRHGELFAEGGEPGASGTSSKDILIAQLGLWAFGIFALLVILVLIRKSLNSMRRHLVKMTERLPLYHDDDLISNHSATSPPLHGKDTTMDTMKK